MLYIRDGRSRKTTWIIYGAELSNCRTLFIHGWWCALLLFLERQNTHELVNCLSKQSITWFLIKCREFRRIIEKERKDSRLNKRRRRTLSASPEKYSRCRRCHLIRRLQVLLATIQATLVWPLSVTESATFRIDSVLPPRFRPTLIVHACRVPREELEDLSRHRVTFGVVYKGR